MRQGSRGIRYSTEEEVHEGRHLVVVPWVWSWDGTVRQSDGDWTAAMADCNRVRKFASMTFVPHDPMRSAPLWNLLRSSDPEPPGPYLERPIVGPIPRSENSFVLLRSPFVGSLYLNGGRRMVGRLKRAQNLFAAHHLDCLRRRLSYCCASWHASMRRVRLKWAIWPFLLYTVATTWTGLGALSIYPLRKQSSWILQISRYLFKTTNY